MLVSIDKKYKTRNGYEVEILKILENPENEALTVIGVITKDEGVQDCLTWHINGAYSDISYPTVWDLVEVTETKADVLDKIITLVDELLEDEPKELQAGEPIKFPPNPFIDEDGYSEGMGYETYPVDLYEKSVNQYKERVSLKLSNIHTLINKII